MKKLLLLCMSVILLLAFTACTAGGSNTASDAMDSAASKTESIASDVGSDISDITDGSSQSNANLKDGKYTAEGKDYDEEGWRPYVEIEVENGKIENVDLDAVNQKGDFKKDDDKFDAWEDKIELFEDEVKAKGIDAIKLNDDGTVSGIEGMDLNVKEYATLLSEAIEKAKK